MSSPEQKYRIGVTLWKGVLPILGLMAGGGLGEALTAVPVPETWQGFQQQLPQILAGVLVILLPVVRNLWKNHPIFKTASTPTDS